MSHAAIPSACGARGPGQATSAPAVSEQIAGRVLDDAAYRPLANTRLFARSCSGLRPLFSRTMMGRLCSSTSRQDVRLGTYKPVTFPRLSRRIP